MKPIVRILFFLFFISTSLSADQLEITVDQKKLQLPFWPAQTQRYGAVLIVRGGEQPHWSDMLAQCANKLATNGWSVVLLNCNPAQGIPWINQLPEVIGSLRKEKNKRIILIHYGDQLNQSLEYFSKPQSKMINALVMISAYGDIDIKDKGSEFRFPIFDVVGQFDYDTVLAAMDKRKKQFKEKSYLAMQMPGADHDYDYSEDLLISFVHGWMTKVPETKTQPRAVLDSYIHSVSLLQSKLVSIANFLGRRS
ncbi:alpha/beta hydrolase [Legionella worsleiensis]|uniref:ATPases involved in biogenesis of archaeal flagella n=1 Tax=Legionella worsleiensis TaxID=45076 RepID=A0A0W1AHW7_9GAMM|nr:alpha/beta hydrolase [Legionella worsleiensis]KTD80755.1 ATPases involved in biogenesis of archaeal flagella [Legionella worsleiensis]STY32666.1 ATPases involved in biogenesis of archaeal flagella [Legionella worsleiensis]